MSTTQNKTDAQLAEERIAQSVADSNTMLREIKQLRNERRDLIRLCGCLFKHTAPGLALVEDNRLLRKRYTHPNGYIQEIFDPRFANTSFSADVLAELLKASQ